VIDLSFAEIAARLQKISLPEVDLVVGIGRGGMVPAVLAGYRLGKEVTFLHLNYRDAQNQPCREQPALMSAFIPPEKGRRILLVDDVSVSGQTLNTAKDLLADYNIATFVLKGQADYVLFPEIKDCVNWPWKSLDPDAKG